VNGYQTQKATASFFANHSQILISQFLIANYAGWAITS
jgi:hypothetical protein